MAIDFEKPTPLYIQIADDIKAKIIKGKHHVGEALGSQRELSDAYDVSLMTIKKALAKLTQEGLLFSRVGKGTYVAAKRPVANKAMPSQNLIGFVLRDLQSPFFSLIAQHAEEAAYKQGYNVLLSNSSGRAEKEEAQIRRFRHIGARALIIASMTHIYHATPAMRALQREQFPFVMVSYMADEDVPFIGTDHEQGGYLATQHLLQLGYKHIGYIDGEEGNLVGELRKRGYGRALAEYGYRMDKRSVFRLRHRGESHDYQSGYEIGKRFTALARRPEAVFVYNDLAALGFQQAILDQGLKVPDDVAIVGFDNIVRGSYAPVPLTTIHQPTAEIGNMAVSTLIQKIAAQEAPARIILQPKLIVRESCGSKLRVFAHARAMRDKSLSLA
ncbi:MAG: GntR family transcriptional regulator [bacterium]